MNNKKKEVPLCKTLKLQKVYLSFGSAEMYSFLLGMRFSDKRFIDVY
jgi:hypothetical protein